MTGPITAQEARDLHPDNAAKHWLDKIYDDIRQLAAAGKDSTRFPYDLTEIAGEGGVRPKGHVGDVVAKELRENGFIIRDHWECRQFVDAYLSVNWGDQ